jgi:hypothetical protein
LLDQACGVPLCTTAMQEQTKRINADIQAFE